MPKVLTEKYKNCLFFLPYSKDKSEGVWCRPLTMTRRNELRRTALQEAGMDSELADTFLCRLLLKESIADWKGFWTPAGEDIPYSKEAVDDMCEHDPVMAMSMLTRILSIAQTGNVEERKN
jgi:hypothetical protein